MRLRLCGTAALGVLALGTAPVAAEPLPGWSEQIALLKGLGEQLRGQREAAQFRRLW